MLHTSIDASLMVGVFKPEVSEAHEVYVMIISSTMLLIVFVWAEIPPPLDAAAVGGVPHYYFNKKLTVCGDSVYRNNSYLLLNSQPNPDTIQTREDGTFVMPVRDEGAGSTSLVIDPKLTQHNVNGRICVTGRLLRHDGLTLEQASAQGKSYVIVDAEFDPQYVLKP